MMDDMFKSIRATLYDRTASPLFGAAAISWIVWNHRMILVLFSGMSAQEKFAYIDGVLYSEPNTKWLLWLVGPAATALLALFIYPYPAKWVYRFWRQRQRELREIRQQIEDSTPLTIDESRKLRRQIIDIQSDYEQQLTKRSEEIERFKKMLSDQQSATAALESRLVEAQVQAPTGTAREIIPTEQVDAALRRMPYRLYYNPDRGRKASKIMLFGPGGKILEGNNDNEHSWGIDDGRLELLQANGKVHSRFDYHPISNVFTHTNEADTLSIKGQYLIPEREEAQQALAADAPKASRG